MPRIPDRFDLWVRQARASTTDPQRQVDWVLGAVVALKELHFVNIGTRAAPLIAKMPIATDECVLAFTDRGRIEEFIAEHPALRKAPDDGPPVITSPTAAAPKWCIENRAGLVLNPGPDETALVPWTELAAFVEEWHRINERRVVGYWIPNMTTEEEDFWQQHGL